jgi:hypothetical protein
MEYKFFNFEGLDQYSQNSILQFCNDFLKNNCEFVKSIYLYGSINTKNYIPKNSNINILFLLNDISYSFLLNNHKIVKKYSHKNFITPLFLTEEHIKSSVDVFPIEFLNIKNTKKLIYGDESLNNLEIDTKNLRLECEEHIKGQLIRIYQLILEIGFSNKKINLMLRHSISSILPVLKYTLYLTGHKVTDDSLEVLNEFSKVYGKEFNKLVDIYKLRESKKNTSDLNLFMDTYIKLLQKIAYIIDGIKI